MVLSDPEQRQSSHRLFIVNGAVQKVSNRCVGGDAGAFPLVAGLESAVGEVSSLDLKCAVSRSISVPSAWTRMCSAGLPCSAGIAMVDISSGRPSPCWIARSLSGNGATGSSVVNDSRDSTPTRMVRSVPGSGEPA